MGPTSSVNNFFGVKISQIGTPVNQANDNQLTYKLDYNTGVQTFYGDNGNSINFGPNPDGTLGFNMQTSNGNLTFEFNGQTWMWYDAQGNTVMMVGYLPVTQVYGWAVAVPGGNLAGEV